MTGPVAGTRTAVVTGASNGIGAACAVRLARLGYDIVGLDLQTDPQSPAVQQVHERVAAHGRALELIRLDVTDTERCRSTATELARTRPVEVFVHAAGVPSSGRAVADTDIAEPQRLFTVHAGSAFALSAALMPALRARSSSSIVFVSSFATTLPMPGGAPYMMAKAALEALGRTLAVEERSHGVRVNVVAPGLVAAGMGHGLARARAGVRRAEDLDAEMPFGRVTRADDVADLVGYLVSSEAALVTGQRVEIHGGRESF